MAIYYIDPDDGSDANNGLGANSTDPTNKPWATIGKALGATGISSGDTVYLKRAAFREVITVAMTSATAETKIIGDIHDEQDWNGAASFPVVLWTGFTTDSTSTSGSGDTLNLNQRDYLTFENIRFYGPEEGKGDLIDAPNSGADQSTNITFRKCEMVFAAMDTTAGGTFYGVRFLGGTSGGAASWLFEDCVFYSNAGRIDFEFQADGATGYDVDVVFRRCLWFNHGTGDHITFAGVAGTGPPGGGAVYDCSFMSSSSNACVRIDPTNTNWSTSTACVVENCVLWGNSIGGTGLLEAQSSGQITSDHNIIISPSPYTNVTKGTNDISSTGTPGYRTLEALALTAPWLWGFVGKRYPYAAISDDLPIIGDGAGSNFSATTDLFGLPRPGSGNATSTPGALEWANTGVKETTTTQAGSTSIKMTGPGVHDFQLAVDATSTTVNVYARFASGTYGGTNYPRMSVRNGENCGVADANVAATASASDAWEQININFTPTSTGIVTIRFENRSNATAGVCFFDTFSVS